MTIVVSHAYRQITKSFLSMQKSLETPFRVDITALSISETPPLEEPMEEQLSSS